MSTFSDKELARILSQPDYELVGGDIQRPAVKSIAAPAAPAPTSDTSQMAQSFETLWSMLDGPGLEPEQTFHEERGWRFDYLHAATRVAIELEGGVYKKRFYRDGRFAGYGGRHMTPSGFVEDCHKYNAARLAGYDVFRLATGMVTPEHVGEIIDYILMKEATA